MLSLLSNRKGFKDRWIGHTGWNAAGLHPLRMQAAAACAAMRRAETVWGSSDMATALARDGIAVIENFLPPDAFSQVLDEARRACAAAEAANPMPVDQPGQNNFGFGGKHTHAWGFDRHDGGTVNRFIEIDRATMPGCWDVARDPRLTLGSRLITGKRNPAKYVRIYQTCHGNEDHNADLQKLLHRDTFFSSMKFWYFLEPVSDDDGPFVYVPGSHRLTARRLAWERDVAMVGCEAAARAGRKAKVSFDDGMAMGGSFRIRDDELGALGLPQPRAYPVLGNTLVIADTLGFHRRGDARPGARRLSIYGNKRPVLPFSLLAS